MKSRRGRPPGTIGRAAILTSHQIRDVFQTAQARPHLAHRSVTALSLSLHVGLRAKELSSLRWNDVFESNGEVREVVHLKGSYTKGGKTRDVFLSCGRLRKILDQYHEDCRPWDLRTPLFPSLKGGHLTPTSMSRFLKGLYVEAGIPKASSHSGRRTMISQLLEKTGAVTMNPI
jgi:integrase/recombinase XerD